MPVLNNIEHIDQLPPIRQIRSALLQQGLWNKLKALLSHSKKSAESELPLTITRIVTSVSNHAELRSIIAWSDITVIHEQSVSDSSSIQQLQDEWYQVMVRASSWRDSRTFHIQK